MPTDRPALPLAACLAALVLGGAAGAQTERPACVEETTLSGEAACLNARAEAILAAMAGDLAAIDAVLGRHGAFAAAVIDDQRAWRDRMEAGCAALEAPARDRARVARAACRARAAAVRAWRLDRALGRPGGAEALFDGLSPEIEIRVPGRR